MSGGLEKRIASVADRLIVVLGLACFLSGLMFLAAQLQRGIYALAGWNYHFVSTGKFLGLKPPYEHAIGWDRSFLWLYGALGLGLLLSLISEFITWANKTPEQRKLERDRAREHAEKERREQREKLAARKFAPN